MKCFRCNFVPFFLQTSLKVGNSTGSSLSHFALQNAPHILYWRQVGTAGRPVKYPYPLPPQPGLVMCAECGFTLSCWNMHGRPWKRCLLEGSILCSKISMYFSALMVPSQKCKLPLPRALTQPHTMTDPGFGLVAGNSLDDPFLLWSGAHGVHSSQKYLKYWFIWPQYTFPLCDGPSQMPPSPEKSTALLDTVNIGLPFGTVQF